VHILTVSKGPDRGKQLRLEPGKSYLVGSSEEAALVLTDPKVLDRHCFVVVENGRIAVQNLTANAGTFMGDKKIDRAELRPGSMFRVGDSVLALLAAPKRPGPNGPPPAPPSPRVSQDDPLVGKIVGGYHIREVVGRGGMGTVYRATQLSLHRDVALKILAPKYAQDEAFRTLFINEARAAGQLVHPNVVQVYDAGSEGAITYFSMEFISQGSVEEILEREGKIPWEKAILMVLEAAHGLDYAEKKHIVHRDIKPDNLMINEDGRVKIADLGLAKRGAGREAGDEGIIGTPHFIPPEQALGKPVDNRADIYSLGATFFRMITGKTLFTGSTAKEIVLKHIKEPPPAPSSIEPGVPPELDLLLSRMLAKEPDARFANAQELIHALEEICAHHGIKGAVIKKGVSKRVLVPLLGLLLAAIGVAVYFVFFHTPAETPEQIAERQRMQREAEEAKQRELKAQQEAEQARLRNRESRARNEFKDLQLAEARLEPKRSEVYDDPALAAEREALWKAMADRYRAFAATEDAQGFALEGSETKLAEAALDAAGAIEKDLEDFKRTADERRALIDEVVRKIKETADTLVAEARKSLDERRYGAAHAILRIAAEGKPEREDPFAQLLERLWTTPGGIRVDPKASQRVMNEIRSAREKVRKLFETVVPSAREDWAAVQKRLDALPVPPDEASLLNAIAWLDEVAARFDEPGRPGPDEIRDVAQKAARQRDARAVELEKLREKLRAADRQAIRQWIVRFRTLSPVANANYVMDAEFDKALAEASKLADAVRTAEGRAFVEDMIARVRWMDWLFRRFRADLEATLAKQGPAPFTSLEVALEPPGATPPAKPVLWTLVERQKGDTRSDATLRRGASPVPIRLGDLPMDVVHDRFFLHEGKLRWAAPDPALRYALAVFCFETCLFDEACAHFRELQGDPQFGALASQWLDAANEERRALNDYIKLLRARSSTGLAHAELLALQKELEAFPAKYAKTLILLDLMPLEHALPGDLPKLPPVPPPPE